MTMISKAAIGIAVGIAGIFVGYCFYFDQKRRSEPDFRKKLRESRRAKQQARKSKLPDLKDHEVVQRFFLQEIQVGELLLAQGDLDGAVEHLSNAIAVCGQPNRLLEVLQKTMPPAIYDRLLFKMLSAGNTLMSPTTMAEDDVE